MKTENFSTGELQKIAIGKALISIPKVILLDNPLVHLDQKLKHTLLDYIIKIQKELQAATLYISSEQYIAMRIADRILLLRNGYIQQIDTPLDIYNNPSNTFVAEFIGYPQMNFITGIIRKTSTNVNFFYKTINILLPNEKANRLNAIKVSDQKLVLGIRPENIHIVNETYKNANGVFLAMVQNIKSVYSESYAEVLIQENITLTLRIPPKVKLKKGIKLYIALDVNRLHIFDYESGNTLSN
jgi:multiple sugar transport system ATP-binding protein